MKTADLTGPQLAQWVAKAMGYKVEREGDEPDDGFVVWLPNGDVSSFGEYGWRPDSNWAHGGPLIEQQDISTSGNWASYSLDSLYHGVPVAHPGTPVFFGKSKLEAAMRAIVFSKFGEEVPGEL